MPDRTSGRLLSENAWNPRLAKCCDTSLVSGRPSSLCAGVETCWLSKGIPYPPQHKLHSAWVVKSQMLGLPRWRMCIHIQCSFLNYAKCHLQESLLAGGASAHLLATANSHLCSVHPPGRAGRQKQEARDESRQVLLTNGRAGRQPAQAKTRQVARLHSAESSQQFAPPHETRLI